MFKVFAILFLYLITCQSESYGQLIGAPMKQENYENSKDFKQLLKDIADDYESQNGKTIDIVKHSDYSTQVVSGVLKRLKITFKEKECDDCNENTCKVKVHEQPWLTPPRNTTFTDCSN